MRYDNYDDESGLHYTYHRYYDSNIGRYGRPDPLGQTSGLNLFIHSNNNPLIYFDKFGLKCKLLKSWEVPGLYSDKPDWKYKYWEEEFLGSSPAIIIPGTTGVAVLACYCKFQLKERWMKVYEIIREIHNLYLCEKTDECGKKKKYEKEKIMEIPTTFDVPGKYAGKEKMIVKRGVPLPSGKCSCEPM